MFKIRRVHLLKIILFLLIALALFLLFAYMVGDFSSLHQRGNTYNVTFNFAGGISPGSHVRVSGINVGRVKSISFNAPAKLAGDPAVTLTIVVSKDAAALIREDSEFHINMAGMMGETYLEITPGSEQSAMIAPSGTTRGIDPPRIDQLIAAAHGVFESVHSVVGDIKPELSQFVTELKTILEGFNKTVSTIPKAEKKKFAANITRLIRNMAQVSTHLTSQDAKLLVDVIRSLLTKADQLNEENIREFLQKEGIRAKVF